MRDDIYELLHGEKNSFLCYVMKELEHAEDMLYSENLPASNFIYWRTRYDALKEIRDKYCEGLD